MGKDIKKMSDYKAKLYIRDMGILKMRKKLLDDGYQKSKANELIRVKFNLKTDVPIYCAIKKYGND